MPEQEPPESYVHRREIPVSLLLCDEPDHTVVEHAAILHKMKHSDAVAAPVSELNTMPRLPSDGGDIPPDSPGPADIPVPVDAPNTHTSDSPEETTDLGVTRTQPDNNSTPSPTQAAEVMLVEFEELTTHTAKCDLCNSRNATGMSRCLICGWQSCHACTIASGCFRTHHINGNIHTGPINKEGLAATARDSFSKSNKKVKLSTPMKSTATQPKQASKAKQGRAIKKPKATKKTNQSLSNEARRANQEALTEGAGESESALSAACCPNPARD
jgi:hypothetical protein